MALRLGICTRYHRHELTRAGIQLAELANDHGIPASIKATRICRRDVAPQWDSKVSGPHVPLEVWARDLSHIIWTECPPLDEISWAAAAGVVPWMLGLWDEIEPEHRGVVRYFDKVITPYSCIYHSLQRLRALKPHLLPWVSALPGIRKKVTRRGAIRILMPLDDSQAERIDMGAFDFVEQLLRQRPQVRVTITCGCNWNKRAREALKRVQQQNPCRAIVVRSPTPFERMELYAAHDLTVWLAQWEGMATVGSDSLQMGTPVITWDNYPPAEYLKNGVNACLVPCTMTYNWLGMGEVVPDYPVMLQNVVAVIDDAQLRATLQQQVLDQSETRHAEFQQGWDKLWQ